MSQFTSSRQVSAQSGRQESSIRGNYESEAIHEAVFKWSGSGEDIVIHGESDF